MSANRTPRGTNGARRTTASSKNGARKSAAKPTRKSSAAKPAAKPKPIAAKPRKKSAPRKYRKSVWLPIGRTSVRIAVLLGGAGLRAVQLQGLDSAAFAAEAAKKMQSSRDIPATRGNIVDRNGVLLATSDPAMTVSIDPDMIQTNGADKRY